MSGGKKMIKVIVFDFGGVCFTFTEFKLDQDLSKELGIPIEKISKARLVKLYEYERGECTEDEYWKTFLAELNKDHDINKLRQIGIDQFKPIPGMQELIDNLNKNYKVGMLSNNTNWIDEINDKYGFYEKFDPLIISKNEGTRKPEEKIFKILIERSNCQPNEIVFTDDTIGYKEATEKAGIHFIHYKNKNQLVEELKKIGVKV